MGPEVGRFERFVSYFSFILSGVLFLFFGTVIFWDSNFLELIDPCFFY